MEGMIVDDLFFFLGYPKMMMFVKGFYSWLSTVGWGKTCRKNGFQRVVFDFLKDISLKITWMDGICTFALWNPGNSPPVSLFSCHYFSWGSRNPMGVNHLWPTVTTPGVVEISFGQSMFFWKCWKFPKFNQSLSPHPPLFFGGGRGRGGGDVGGSSQFFGSFKRPTTPAFVHWCRGWQKKPTEWSAREDFFHARWFQVGNAEWWRNIWVFPKIGVPPNHPF